MDDANVVTLNLSAGEIVQPGSCLEIRASRPVDPRSAQGAVRLLRGGVPVNATPKIVEKGRVLQLHTGAFEPGRYELVVTELLDVKGKCLADRLAVPFAMVPLSGEIPPGARVEGAVRLVVGELGVQRLAPGEHPAGGFVDMVKAVDRVSNAPMELAFNAEGNRVDAARLLEGVTKRRAEKFGRVHETLWERMEKAKDDEKIDVIIWPRLDLPPAPYAKTTDVPSREPPAGEQDVEETVRRATRSLRTVLSRAGLNSGRPNDEKDPLMPTVHITTTVAQIRELGKSDAIGVILLDDKTAIPDLSNSMAVARSAAAHSVGFDGTGIRVGVWEDGPSDTTDLIFADRFSATPPASHHARLTSAIVKNTEPNRPHGHAPDCDLYSANSYSTDALRWAVRDKHCTVVSQSFHRDSEQTSSALSADDLLKDWLALRWPYPTIVQAAGNGPDSEFVNHKGYNGLAVGNHDDVAAAMAADSVFRNPTTRHGDRELPEIAGNGTGVFAVHEGGSGTSFAAPAVAGVTALLQDVDGVLTSWPEGCRAILLASAGRNVAGLTWWQDVSTRTDASDGAGAADAQAGTAIAQQRRWRDAPGTRRGWDVGTLSSSVVGADGLVTFRYHVVVPSSLLLPRAKVALAWDSAVTSSGSTATASTLTVDLDLIIRDSAGNHIASAASWDNSYEIVEFAARPGQTYEIAIRRWSGTDSVWYGIAWTVTGLLMVFPWTFAALDTRLVA